MFFALWPFNKCFYALNKKTHVFSPLFTYLEISASLISPSFPLKQSLYFKKITDYLMDMAIDYMLLTVHQLFKSNRIYDPSL